MLIRFSFEAETPISQVALTPILGHRLPTILPLPKTWLLEPLLQDPFQQRISMVSFDGYPYPFYDENLQVTAIHYDSPLEIEATPSERSLRALLLPRLKEVVKVVMNLLAIDHLRDGVRWETELKRQKAIEAALKNYAQTLEIGKRIRDPDARDEFTRNMAKTIGNLTTLGRPMLKTLEVQETRSQNVQATD
jgi:hypothetical protein